MRFILFFIAFIIGFNSCTSSSSTTSVSKPCAVYKDYYVLLDSSKSISQFVDKKIYFEGKISRIPYQHMMKSSPFGDEQHVYVDYNTKGGQVVAYYKEGLVVPKDDKSHKFYGTVSSMSGAGKGGGTHTEYYLDLDKVE